MPASLPGSTLAENQGNPSAGSFVIFDPLSGPLGSPLDLDATDASNCSTGALSTGIGLSPAIISQSDQYDTAPEAIFAAGFDDAMIPGEEATYAAPPPNGVRSANTIDSTILYIGGGRMIANTGTLVGDVGRPFIPDPYDAGIAICGAGQGATRDGGAGPAFTGFPMQMATATGAVANGAAIEAGIVNRSGKAMVSGESGFGLSATELAAAS